MVEFPFNNSPQPPADMSNIVKKHGHKFLMLTIVLAVLVVIISIFAIWSYVNYTQQKTNVDSKVATAVAEAKKAQLDKDEQDFTEREKNPNLVFAGPEDYGSVTFSYPKTWSVYIGKDAANGGNYEAYLNPVSVPPVSLTQQFALRVLIQQSDYDKIIASYSTLVKKDSLRSSSVTVNGVKGTRLEGNFTKDIRGLAVIFKIRDKTLTIRTDASTFKTDFDKLIKTIKFIQ